MEEYSLRSQVFQTIRDDILKGKYEENDELREATLGKELGVSRTPVREALRQLELEGLVNIIPNKGAYVTGISDKDVHDIYMIRSMLEGLCVRWATEHITQEQLEELDEIILLSEYHMDKGHSDQLTELDKWAYERLDELNDKARAGYDALDYHVAFHAIHNFCVVEMSNFYLDVIKDRLYCEERNGLKRRSAQTALFLILDSMTKMFAPILAFTCDEIWLAMPHRAEDDARNVLLNVMNQPFDAYALSEDELAKWDQLIRVRTDVNGVLEAARAEKRIGKPLEAAVTLRADDDAAKAALDDVQSMNLPELLIVSQCLVGGDVPADAVTGTGTNFPGLHISVHNAPGTKCPRCWMHSEQADPETGLCPRCAAVVAAQKAE